MLHLSMTSTISPILTLSLTMTLTLIITSNDHVHEYFVTMNKKHTTINQKDLPRLDLLATDMLKVPRPYILTHAAGTILLDAPLSMKAQLLFIP